MHHNDTMFGGEFHKFSKRSLNKKEKSNLDILAKYQPTQAFYGSKSKLAHCKSKTIAILEIKDLVSCYPPSDNDPFFDSTAISLIGFTTTPGKYLFS